MSSDIAGEVTGGTVTGGTDLTGGTDGAGGGAVAPGIPDDEVTGSAQREWQRLSRGDELTRAVWAAPPLTMWADPDPAALDWLAVQGVRAAGPVLGQRQGAAVAAGRQLAQSECTDIVVRAALRCLLANGLIRAVPSRDWPDLIMLDVPKGLPS